jgi:ABC-2 type transport system permease protein
LPIAVRYVPAATLGVLFSVILGSAIFSTFSFIIACIVETRERSMGIGQILTMPMFFASNAIYPLDLMPNWLQVIAHLNPLTYLVDAL